MEQSLQTNDQDRQECPLTDIVKLDAPLNELLQQRYWFINNKISTSMLNGKIGL